MNRTVRTLAALAAAVSVGAAAAPFAPTDIADLRMWLDASAITGKVDGDRVHRWEDSSANNVDMGTFFSRYGNSADRSPTYETNELSGRPVLRFSQDGTVDDYMNTGSIWAPGANNLGLAQPATLITVFAPRNAAGDAANWAFSSNQVQYHSNVIRSQVGPFPIWMSSVTETLNSYNVDALTFQGTDVSSQYYRNGTLFRSGVVGTTASGQTGALGELGLAAKAGPGGGHKPVDYAEVIAINRVINAAERNALDFYLEMKYDLPTSAGGVMLTGTMPGNTITSSATVDTLLAPVDIVDTHRGSVAVDLASIGMARLTFLLDFVDADGPLDSDGLLAWLNGLSNGGQFYSVSLPPTDYAGYDLAVRYSGLPGTMAYFNWDTGDATVQLSRIMAIPEPTSGLLLALAGLAGRGRRRRRD